VFFIIIVNLIEGPALGETSESLNKARTFEARLANLP
jgi:hypothetical protein